jgi:hypothetical protein
MNGHTCRINRHIAAIVATSTQYFEIGGGARRLARHI